MSVRWGQGFGFARRKHSGDLLYHKVSILKFYWTVHLKTVGVASFMLRFFPGGVVVKNPMQEMQELQVQSLGSSPGGGDGTHSSTLAWKTPWTEEPGGLQSMGSQRVGHD